MPGLSPLAVLAGLGQGYEQNISQGQKSRQANADLELARAKIKEMQDAIDAEEDARKAGLARPPRMSLTGVPATPTQPQGPGPLAPAVGAAQSAIGGPSPAPGAPPSPPPGPAGPFAPSTPLPVGGPPAASAPTTPQPTALPAGGAPGASGGPQSDPAAAFSPEAIQQRYLQIWDGMKAANPELTDGQVNIAVNNLLKAQAEIVQLTHPQAGIIIQEGNIAARERGQTLQHEDRQASLAERAAADRSREINAANRTNIYGEMMTLNHEDRQAAIAAMNERAANSISDRDRIEASHEGAAMARLDEAIENKDWATVAQIQAGDYRAQAQNAPAGQTPPAPKVAAPPKLGTRGGGAASSTPPATALKKGVHTKFANGQVWTLDANGKPQRVS